MTRPEGDVVLVRLAGADDATAPMIGTLRRVRAGSRSAISFAYDPDWLQAQDGFEIDPVIGWYPGEQFSATGGLHGIFQDAAPDRWGRSLMERREASDAIAEGRAMRRLGEWDYLLGVSDHARIGALRLQDPKDGRYLDDRPERVPPIARLRQLEAAAQALESLRPGDPRSEARWLKLLLAPGSSLGGARPKASFVDESGAMWMAKFPSHQDRHDVGAWEFVLHTLAGRAGITVPPARLLSLGSEYRTFAARRFDRDGDTRRLYTSAMTLTGRHDGEDSSYLDIVEAIADHGDPATIGADMAELFRRLTFNVMVGDRDDHLRNHGFVRSASGWRLAPAFDLNPAPDQGQHTLSIDGATRDPDLAPVRGVATHFRIAGAEADRIIGAVGRAVADWRAEARALGIGANEVKRMESAFLVG